MVAALTKLEEQEVLEEAQHKALLLDLELLGKGTTAELQAGAALTLQVAVEAQVLLEVLVVSQVAMAELDLFQQLPVSQFFMPAVVLAAYIQICLSLWVRQEAAIVRREMR